MRRSIAPCQCAQICPVLERVYLWGVLWCGAGTSGSRVSIGGVNQRQGHWVYYVHYPYIWTPWQCAFITTGILLLISFLVGELMGHQRDQQLVGLHG